MHIFLLYAVGLFSAAMLVITVVTMHALSPWLMPGSTGTMALYDAAGYAALLILCLLGVAQKRARLALTAGAQRFMCIPLGLALIETGLLLPCLLPGAGALCGVFSGMMHQLAGSAAMIGLALALVRMQPGVIRRWIIIALVVLAGLFTLQHVLRRPDGPEDCVQISDALARSNCMEGLARKSANHELCLQISYDFIRFSCLSDIAAKTANPALCGHIRNLPGDHKAAPTLPSDAKQAKERCLAGTAGFKGSASPPDRVF